MNTSPETPDQGYKNRYIISVVRLEFPSKHGITLWTSVPDDYDILISVDQNVLVFRSSRLLVDFVTSGALCNLSGRPEYEDLQRALSNSNARLRPEVVANFASAMHHMKDGDWKDWDVETREHVLLCLNMLWDLASTQKNEALRRALKGNTPLGKLADYLTFAPPTQRGRLRKLESKETADAFAEQVLCAERLVLQVC
jgi:hypothetical protein